MEIKKVSAAHGWLWIRDGFYLILRNPILSMALAGAVAIGIFLALNIPFFGPFLGIMLIPTLVAGYMRALQALDRHEEMELAHLLAGFGKAAPKLITLGGVLLVGVIIISAAMIEIGGNALTSFLEIAQSTNDPQVIVEALLSAGPEVNYAMLVGMSLLLLLLVCLQFAPMLVILDDAKSLAAIKATIIGTFRNILSYIVFMLIFQVLIFLASTLPKILSIFLLLPVGMASLYAAYRDIYTWPEKSPRLTEGKVVTRDD